MQVAIDLNLFEHLKAAGEKSISPKELASPSGADPELVRKCCDRDQIRRG